MDNAGTHSCGKYLAAVQGHAPGAGMMRGQFSDDHFLYMAWLGGFFSAIFSVAFAYFVLSARAQDHPRHTQVRELSTAPAAAPNTEAAGRFLRLRALPR